MDTIRISEEYQGIKDLQKDVERLTASSGKRKLSFDHEQVRQFCSAQFEQALGAFPDFGDRSAYPTRDESEQVVMPKSYPELHNVVPSSSDDRTALLEITSRRVFGQISDVN